LILLKSDFPSLKLRIAR